MTDETRENSINNNGLAIHWKILIALVLGAIAGYLSGGASVLGTPLRNNFV